MQDYLSLLRIKKLPTTWCPGCGNGLVLKSLAQVLHADKPAKLVLVCGIGCIGRSGGYLNFDTVHTLHGRAIPVAEGLKAADPSLTVIVLSGDGDLLGIGGNHLMHASRRKAPIKVICVNNRIYGMTGGQVSPTTPEGAITASTPGGSVDMPMKVQPIVTSYGNLFARSTVFHLKHLREMMGLCMKEQGFSFLEVLSNCYQGLGKRSGFNHPYEMIQSFRNFKVKDNPEEDEIGCWK